VNSREAPNAVDGGTPSPIVRRRTTTALSLLPSSSALAISALPLAANSSGGIDPQVEASPDPRPSSA
jgi:hypothetical protein